MKYNPLNISSLYTLILKSSVLHNYKIFLKMDIF
nr:MAG TPA: hypothetical protein [Caudoviricetes sp.]